jgi:hypothetical protein
MWGRRSLARWVLLLLWLLPRGVMLWHADGCDILTSTMKNGLKLTLLCCMLWRAVSCCVLLQVISGLVKFVPKDQMENRRVVSTQLGRE